MEFGWGVVDGAENPFCLPSNNPRPLRARQFPYNSVHFTMIEEEEHKVKKERGGGGGGGREGGLGSRCKVNLKVSTSETWFPELERVLSSEKEEHFFPEDTGAPGALGSPGLTLHGRDENLGPHWLCRLPAATGGPTGLLPALTPLPRQDVGYHGHRNHRTRCKAASCPLLPRFAECIVTIHVTK